MLGRQYTPEEVLFIRKKVAGRSYAELTDLFNARFGLRGRKKISLSQMTGFVSRHKLRNGRDCRFRPGHVAHNKGKKGYCPAGSEKGWFKLGNIPQTWQPVGTEIIDSYGYVKVKTRNPKTWKFKHRLIWEKTHGKIPRGHIVIFSDGNKRNFALDNLLLVSRAEHGVMNRWNLRSSYGGLTRTGKAVADLKLLITSRERGEAKKGRSRRYTRSPGRR